MYIMAKMHPVRLWSKKCQVYLRLYPYLVILVLAHIIIFFITLVSTAFIVLRFLLIKTVPQVVGTLVLQQDLMCIDTLIFI